MDSTQALRTALACALLLSTVARISAIRHAKAGCLAACPAKPTAHCDFYFKGHPTAIPSFSLSAKARGEQDLGSVVLHSTTAKLTNIASTGAGCTTTAIPAGTTPAGTTGNQFYGTGTWLKARTFNTPNVTAFVPNCVLLPITSAQLLNGTQTINLNTPGPNRSFPAARRCVVFKIAA